MATSEKVKFCSTCGNKCRFTDRFCGTCGENVSDKTSIDDKRKKKDIRTSDDYILINSKKKRFPASSTITTRSKFFKKVNDKPVMINVVLIRAAEDKELSIVRGSKLPVQVKKGFDADQVLKSNVKKHVDHDQHFCGIENNCFMYPDMKIVDVAPETRHKFTVQKYKDDLGRQYSKIDLYLRKSVNAEKNCTSENWFEEVINPNAIYDNTISAEKFFRSTLTNQDGNFELESPKNYETSVSSERLESAKPAAVTSTVPIISTKHMDSDEEPIAPVFSTPEISNAESIYYPIFQPSIDTSPTFSPVNVGTKVFCPISNKRFFVTETKKHADVCLTRKTQRNINDITNDW